MLPAAYRTAGLHTEVYDVLTEPSDPSIRGDVGFYLDLAQRNGGTVLDLGCGTGRVSLPLAREGLEVVGVDISKAMLDRATFRRELEDDGTASRLSFVQANMVNFDLGRQFGTVLVPYRSFQMLLTREEQRTCLTSIRAHLEEGGAAAIDLFDPDLALLALDAWGGPELDWEGEHPVTGNRVRSEIVERRNDRVEQTLLHRFRFTEFGPDGDEVRREEEVLQMRWLYRYEMHNLLELCGFELEAEYSDYVGSPPAYAGEQLYVARGANS